MKLETQELEIISGLVQKYKEMPEEKRRPIRELAYNRSIWQGNLDHDRAINRELHTRFLIADAELRAKQSPKFEPPTMRETCAAVRATVAWIAPVVIPIAGFIAVGYIALQALMGFGTAVYAFFTSYGGMIIGVMFGVFCLSALFGGQNAEPMETQVIREEKRQVIINVNVDGEQNVKVG